MAQWLIEKAGVPVTIRCEGEAVEALIAPMLADLQAQPSERQAGNEISVKGQDGDWQLSDPAAEIQRSFDQAGDLIYLLSDRILFHIANRATSVHCVHAAAVAANGRAMVIPGNSGAGKSSFTAWLVAHGFDYLTDELILLNGNSVSGISRPIQIKHSGIEAVASLLSPPGSIIEGRRSNAVFPERLGGKTSHHAEHELAAIVYTAYEKDAGFSFEPISSAEAGMRLMENHVNARNLEGHGFRDTMRLIRETPCFRLEYGGFDKLPADFSARLWGILRGSV